MMAQRAELSYRVEASSLSECEGDVLCVLLGVKFMVVEFWGSPGLLVCVLEELSTK